MMDFKIFPNKLTRLLIFITLGLGLASLAGQFYVYFWNGENFSEVVRMFNVDLERNLPTIFSALILLFSSLLIQLIALSKLKNKDKYAYHWQGLSIIFMYLSVDELIEIHEKVNKILLRFPQSTSDQKWDILNIVFVTIFVLFYLKFFFHLPKKIQGLFILAFSLYVIGGVGIELFGVFFLTNIYNQQTFWSQVIATIEECLEMIGVSIFIHALLIYGSSFIKDIHIQIFGSEKKYLTNETSRS